MLELEIWSLISHTDVQASTLTTVDRPSPYWKTEDTLLVESAFGTPNPWSGQSIGLVEQLSVWVSRLLDFRRRDLAQGCPIRWVIVSPSFLGVNLDDKTLYSIFHFSHEISTSR